MALDPLETPEVAAMADVFAAIGGRDGFEHRTVGGAWCCAARRVPAPELNRVAGANADTDLEAVAAFYAGTAHLVSQGPAAGGLADALRACGYRQGYAWMKFARRFAEAPAARTDLRLEIVGADRAQDFAVPVVGGFGMPPLMLGATGALPGRAGWTCLVAYDGDRPVAGGAVFVDGDQAWLGLGATLPEARGRGAQSALLAERIRLAAEAGATTVTTETGVRQEGRPERSYRNILRAGFEEVFERPNWTSP